MFLGLNGKDREAILQMKLSLLNTDNGINKLHTDEDQAALNNYEFFRSICDQHRHNRLPD